MVKGIAKRVVVVKLDDLHLFEQAILLMRDGCDEGGVTEAQILQEANDIAVQYQHEQGAVPKEVFRPWLTWSLRLICAFGGAGLTGLMWLVFG